MAFSSEINFEEVLKKISEQFLTQISLTCSALHLKDPEKGWHKVAFFHNESSLDPSQLYIECSTEELETIALSKIPRNHIPLAVVTQMLALTPKSANVTLHLHSEATQSSSLESRLSCEKSWYSLSSDGRGCLYAG